MTKPDQYRALGVVLSLLACAAVAWWQGDLPRALGLATQAQAVAEQALPPDPEPAPLQGPDLPHPEVPAADVPTP